MTDNEPRSLPSFADLVRAGRVSPEGSVLNPEGVIHVNAVTIDATLCDCNEAERGYHVGGRHLPSCRYGIIEDWIDGRLLVDTGTRTAEHREPDPAYEQARPTFADKL